MDVAPPPVHGSRVHDLGDRLIVRVGPRRSWGEIAFLAFWLTFWTAAGSGAADTVAEEGWTNFHFLHVWLVGWAFGEALVSLILVWRLFGRELVGVDHQQLEVRQEIGRFARSKRYHAVLVDDVRPARVPSAEDEPPRKDFGLSIHRGDETIHVGGGMNEREAEYLAALVLLRLRPETAWGRHELPQPHADLEHPLRPSPSRLRRAAVSAAALVLVAAGVYFLGQLSGYEDPRQPNEPPSALQPAQPKPPGHPIGVQPSGPRWPSMSEFSSPGEYAGAMTLYSLRSAGRRIVGRPRCRASEWVDWSCSVPARASSGPYAGITLSYVCSPSRIELVSGRLEVRGVDCGPADPPPIGG